MKEISIEQLAQALNENQIRLIDVREVDEFQAGHVPGAELIPMGVIPARTMDLDRSESIALICRTGGRSGQVTTWLESQGFNVANVVGGTEAWISSGRAVER